MSDFLLLVGGSARAAAFSALRAGMAPIAGDLFADTDLKRCCGVRRIKDYPEGLRALFRTAPAGPWMYVGGLENCPRLVARLAAQRTLYGNGADVLRRVRNPQCLAAALACQDLPFPAMRTRPVGAGRDGSWLRKRRASTGGSGTAVWDGSGWPASGADAGFYLQRRIRGRPVAALFVAARRQSVLLGITRQLVGTTWARSRGFGYSGSVGPLALSRRVVDGFRRIGAALSDHFGLVGLFGVDAILRGEEVWPVEVNPRYTASVEILERALNFHAVAMHVQACREGHLPPPPVIGATDCCGKAILFAPREVHVPHAFAGYVRREAGTMPWPNLADVPAVGTLIHRRAPVATALAAGRDVRSVVRLLRDRVAAMERCLLG